MNHRVISLKYRPQDFDELTGQSHVVLSLKGAIKSGRIGHAFLFAGPRGVGKTTAARIFAKSLNCIEGPTVHPCQKCQSCREIAFSRSIDVVEIDGASNRGIDEIRNLREAVQYSPLYCKYKVYIIDEVHMLTNEAFNALLKTLEEPPPSVVFVFATTNPVKIPQTILSRCERFIFKRLSVKEISARLKSIAQKEGVSITEKALHYTAVRADGSVRDGESILEQLISFVEGTITEEDVFKLIGFLSGSFYSDLLEKIVLKRDADVLVALNQGIEDGADPVEIYRGLVDYLRAALLVHSGMPGEFLDLGDEDICKVKKMSLDRHEIMRMLEVLLNAEDSIKRSMNTRIALELVFFQLLTVLEGPPAKQNGGNPGNIKEAILRVLQVQIPKLAALIQGSAVTADGAYVCISVKDDFAKSTLMSNQGVLQTILKKLLNRDVSIRVVVANEKKANNLEETIRALFDGEEVR
ncbi:MAG: DNA polymerase III subunit gamma/tau [candidate division WOR-3 bacterium]|nr:MAG: DNA polymerase III subunit gamma/tau [candidate division WOR-3 bacterium]